MALFKKIMQTLSPNKSNLILRTFSLMITCLIAHLLFHYGINESKSSNAILLMYLMIGIIIFLAVTIISSLLAVNKILIDSPSNTISFFGLFFKIKIRFDDINEYAETVHKIRNKIFYGVLIKLKDGRKIHSAGQNVKSLPLLKEYLSANKIKYTGQRKMRFPFN